MTNLRAVVEACSAVDAKMRAKAESKVAMCRRMASRIRDNAKDSSGLAEAMRWEAKALAWRAYGQGGPAPLGSWAR